MLNDIRYEKDKSYKLKEKVKNMEKTAKTSHEYRIRIEEQLRNFK